MTQPEVQNLMALMRANYSSAFKSMSQQDQTMMLNTWTFILQDLDANVVMIAVMQLISASKWLPTVAEIREKCQALYRKAQTANLTFDFGETPEYKTKALNAIAARTCHLNGKSAEISLDTLLNNPQFAAMTISGSRDLLEAMGQGLPKGEAKSSRRF